MSLKMSNSIFSLSAGELVFIANPSYSNGFEMIKMHITDLIFRGIVELEKKRVPIQNGVGTVNHFYVTKGVNFTRFVPEEFERYFIQPFVKENKNLPLGIYALYVLGKFKNEVYCKEEYFFDSLNDKGVIKKSWLPMSYYKITEQGKPIQNIVLNKKETLNKETSITAEEYCNLIHTSGFSFLLQEKNINWRNLEEIRLEALQLVLKEINSLTKNENNQPIFSDKYQQEYLNLMINHLGNQNFSFLNFTENYYDHMDLGFDSEM